MFDKLESVDINNKRIVIFGGSFNPIHNGHISCIMKLQETYKFDYVVFIPVNIPVHKDDSEMIAPYHRLEMVRLAVRNLDYAIVSDIEIVRGAGSYTIDTVRQIKTMYPDVDISVAFSDDLLAGLSKWKQIEILQNEAHLICMTRSKTHIFPPYKVTYFKNEILSISSTEIRDKIKQGQIITDLVDPSVAEYINRLGLYR